MGGSSAAFIVALNHTTAALDPQPAPIEGTHTVLDVVLVLRLMRQPRHRAHHGGAIRGMNLIEHLARGRRDLARLAAEHGRPA